MNRLEKYIRDNKDLFDEEPAAGHFERLQQKINRKSKRIMLMRWSFSIAASVAIVLLAGILWQKDGKQKNLLAICENAQDMRNCYLDKMNAVAFKIESLTENLDQWDKQQVMIDVQNIINIADSGFESEIPEELPAKKAKLILSDFYRQNLESLEMIVEELQIMN